jgi:hypothetical protein
MFARELATCVQYHIAEYTIRCKKCNYAVRENNETEPKMKNCPRCNGFKFEKKDFKIMVWEFKSMEDCDMWIDNRMKTYHRHFIVTDIEKTAFPYYDTYQWENLITEDL